MLPYFWDDRFVRDFPPPGQAGWCKNRSQWASNSFLSLSRALIGFPFRLATTDIRMLLSHNNIVRLSNGHQMIFVSKFEDHTWVCFYSYLEMLKTSKMPVLLGLGMIMSKWLEPSWINVCLSSWLSFTVNQIYTTEHRLELTAQWKSTTLCIRRAEKLEANSVVRFVN